MSDEEIDKIIDQIIENDGASVDDLPVDPSSLVGRERDGGLVAGLYIHEGNIVLDFGREVTDVSLTPKSALALARTLVECAKKASH